METGIRADELQVVKDTQVVKQRPVLHHQCCLCTIKMDDATIQRRVSWIRKDEFQQAGFTATAGTDNGNNLAVIDLKIELIKQCAPAAGQAKITDR